MSLGPDREPTTRPVYAWLEVAAQLVTHGDGGLAAQIRQAMDGRRLGDIATFALTADERRRVDHAAKAWRGEQVPD